MKKWSTLKKALTIFTLVIVLILAFSGYDLFSRTKFPKPTGQYKVGTAQLELVDTARTETYTSDPTDNRRLLVQIYYPATTKENAKRVVYTPAPEEMEEGINKAFGVPKLLIKRLSRSTTHFYNVQDATPVAEKFPVILFSHGWDGSRFQNSFQLGELASQGYVVVSIEHTYNASGTLFKDGTKGDVVSLDQMQDTAYSSAAMNVWTADQQFVLNSLEELQKDNRFFLAKQMDIPNVGVFGHSFGGATSATTLALDKRFKAGINMDGFYFGNAYKIGFEQPFMEIRADVKPTEQMTDKDLKEWKVNREYYQYLMFDEWNKRINQFAKNGYTTYFINKANHMSFSDFSYLMPFSFITAPDRNEHHQVTNELVLSFFNKHLKGSEYPVGVSAELKKYLKQ